MKKQKTLVVLLLTLAMIFAFGATSAIAANNEVLNIKATDVIYGDKGPLNALDMKGGSDVKEIWIEGGALTKAKEKGLTFGINMGDVKISFAPDAFFTDKWKSVVGGSDPLEIKLLIDTTASIDLADTFKETTQNAKGNYSIDHYGVTIEAYLYVSGKNVHTMTKFATPVKMTYNYKSSLGGGIGGNLSEKNITMSWFDIDRKISNTREWLRVASKVDLTNKTVTSTSAYACGLYMPIACKGLDNSGGTSSGGNTGGETPPAPTGGIPDGHWATADILTMQQNGVVPSDLSGVQVDKPISRAEFASFIVAALKLPEDISLAGKFNDVKTDNPYYKAILTGAFYDILNGVSDNKFDPNAGLTRQEMATIFNRALVNRKITVNGDTAALNKMADAASVATWAKDGAAVCVNMGLISGQENNKFAPKSATTWAESVVMLNRLYKLLNV